MIFAIVLKASVHASHSSSVNCGPKFLFQGTQQSIADIRIVFRAHTVAHVLFREIFHIVEKLVRRMQRPYDIVERGKELPVLIAHVAHEHRRAGKDR